MLFSIIKWLVRDQAQEIQARNEVRSALVACIDPQNETELDVDLEKGILAAAQEAVRGSLNDPKSAVFSDQSIYSRGVWGYAVCGAVECTNLIGQSVQNFFVADVHPEIRGVGCEILDSDPRDRTM
ncbi:MAG: hypothetical protein JWN40_3565 [Phycisphaerales bacterium]|nr:hypothetical protein [Phycisphaerales bacterium]